MLYSRTCKGRRLFSIAIVTVFLGALFLGSTNYSNLDLFELEKTNTTNESLYLSSYEQMDPILIEGNSELAEFALNESLEGDGSPGNPYILKDYQINGTGYRYAIQIRNTDYHFKLRNFLTYGTIEYASLFGYITFHNVSNGFVNGMVIQSASSRCGIAINLCENITITNSSITGGGFAVDLERTTNLTFTNNRAVSAGHGFWLTQLNNTIIANNSVNTCIRGYMFGEAIDCQFINNTVENASNEGFLLATLDYCLIADNNATDCFNYGYRLAKMGNCSITNNIAIVNFHEGYYIYDSEDSEFIGNFGWNTGDNLHLYDCFNITVADNVLNGGRPGCNVESTYNCSFLDNTFYLGTYGFFFQNSGNCTLNGNDIIEVSDDGILLEHCENFTLISNTITNCTDYGFQLQDSNETVIESNSVYFELSETILGFYLNASHNVSVSNNVVYSDGRSDFLFESSPGCVLSNNTVFDIKHPTVSHSSNVESFDYYFGSQDRWIRWYSYDLLPDNYTITRNGTVVDTGVWTSGIEIFTSVVGLEVGIHIYEIVVADSSGNTANDVATFEVLATSTPTIPTTTSTPTFPTSTPPTNTPVPPPPMMTTLLLIGGVGVALIVVIILWLKKK